jgi:hypothetical protein
MIQIAIPWASQDIGIFSEDHLEVSRCSAGTDFIEIHHRLDGAACCMKAQ